MSLYGKEFKLSGVAGLKNAAEMRKFDSGATRNVDTDKIDPEGFLSPEVETRFFEYMQEHRLQADGTLRDSDNWQRGIPTSAYMKSMWRHFLDVWRIYRGLKPVYSKDIEDALCALKFNVNGFLLEALKRKRQAIPVFDAQKRVDNEKQRLRELYNEGAFPTQRKENNE
jgi:hypothetical protein